jgi:nitroreductase
VATSAADREALRAAAHDQEFVSEAPVCLVFCADPDCSASKYGDRGRDLYAIQDATIAATYAQLAVAAAGMASTWVGSFDEDRVRNALELDAGLMPVAMLCIGYPAEFPEPTPRRHMDELVVYR